MHTEFQKQLSMFEVLLDGVIDDKSIYTFLASTKNVCAGLLILIEDLCIVAPNIFFGFNCNAMTCL